MSSKFHRSGKLAIQGGDTDKEALITIVGSYSVIEAAVWKLISK